MAYIDIEDALQALLTADGYNACAKPLPANFTAPHITVDLLNAADVNAAQAVYNVDFDVRADDYAGAVSTACAIADWARKLEGSTIGGVPCYRVDTLRIGRAAPDPSNQQKILATVSAGLRLRVADM